MEPSIELPTIIPDGEKTTEDKKVESPTTNDASTVITNEMETAKEVKTVEVPKSESSSNTSSETMNSFGVCFFSPLYHVVSHEYHEGHCWHWLFGTSRCCEKCHLSLLFSRLGRYYLGSHSVRYCFGRLYSGLVSTHSYKRLSRREAECDFSSHSSRFRWERGRFTRTTNTPSCALL